MIIRFGVSLEKELLSHFDAYCRRHAYSNRSEAVRNLIRDALVREEWEGPKGAVTGVITLVYDHHQRELVDKLIDIQHGHQRMIVSGQHIHLDRRNCLEVIILKGPARKARHLADKLRSTRGVKYGELVMATTGKGMG